MRFFVHKALSLFLLGLSLSLFVHKKVVSKENAYWKIHYEQLRASKKLVDSFISDDKLESISQIEIKNDQGEILRVLTQRDRMNNFSKTLITPEGVALARIEYYFTAQSCCYIKMFYAFKKEHGYGTLLFRLLLKELKLQGYTRVELHSIPEAEPFYIKHGFDYVKQYVSPNLFPHLVVMGKQI